MKAYCEHETLIQGREPEDISFGEGELKHCLEIKLQEDFINLLNVSQCVLLALLLFFVSRLLNIVSYWQQARTTQTQY